MHGIESITIVKNVDFFTKADKQHRLQTEAKHELCSLEVWTIRETLSYRPRKWLIDKITLRLIANMQIEIALIAHDNCKGQMVRIYDNF